ncbi:MAG: superoxide dismutase [Gaiellaceae bacterium]
MRRITLLLMAVLALGATAALAKGTFPNKIALPDAFAPEGLEIAKGKTIYVGSVGNGAVWVGDLRTGTGRILVEGVPDERSATGIEYDRGRLWVSGARFGNVLVYDARSGELSKEIQLATGTDPTFVNDAVATKKAVYLTDSQRPMLYKVALERKGAPGAVSTIPLTGDYQHVAGQFNLNGIVATRNGKTLIAVQSAARKLYTIDPGTGAAKLIDLGGYDLSNGDGLLLKGRKLFVVQNRDNKVAVFELSQDLAKATFVRALTDPELDVPTTVDRAGKRLYVVNARFGTTTPTDQAYWITRLR